MQIMVLGGAGAMARAAVRDLIAAKDVSQVAISDIDGEKAKRFAEELNSNKVSTIQLDIHDHDRFVESMRSADAVLDGIPHDFTLPVVKGIFEAKVNGCCIGGCAYTTQEILQMDNLVKEAGITYLLSAGLSP